MQIIDRLLDRLRTLLHPLVERKFVFRDSWELEQVTHKQVKLPYVLLENKSSISNKFWIPIRLVDIRMDIYNKGQRVGKILYDDHIRVPSRSVVPITLEVRMSHITALFNLLRFVIVQNITMEVRGEVHIRLFRMDFFIPIHDHIDIPKSKFQMLRQTLNFDETYLDYEDIEQQDTHIEVESPSTDIPEEPVAPSPISEHTSDEHTP